MLPMQELPAEMFLLDAYRRVFVMQRQQSRLPFPPQPECMLRKMTKAMREQRRVVPEVRPHICTHASTAEGGMHGMHACASSLQTPARTSALGHQGTFLIRRVITLHTSACQRKLC